MFFPSSTGGLDEAACPTVATKLRRAGYATVMLGKWHLGSAPGFLPHEAGFDSWLGLPYSHEEGYPGPFPEGLIWPPVPLMANGTILEQPFDSNTLTDRYTAGAVAAIDAAELRSNPLFLHVAYEAPHVPLFAGPAFRAASGHQTPSRELRVANIPSTSKVAV